MGVLFVIADLLTSLFIGVRLVGVIVPKPIGLLLRSRSVFIGYCLA